MLTTGCLCSCKKFLVKEGELVLTVRSYGKESLSNTFAILLAAHI